MKNGRIQRDNIPAQNTRLPLIGKIKVGMKNEKGLPVSLDYFRATGSYASKFYEVYPEKPDRVQIIFISDDNIQSCYEEWDGRDKEGRRAGYGDGVEYYLWDYQAKDYRMTTSKDEVAKFSRDNKIRWRQILTINFIIPAIKGVFGMWQLQTGGDKTSINAIRNTFDEIKELAGTVVNIPFDLCVKKVTSNKPEAKSSYPVVTLIPNISQENIEILRQYLQTGLDIKRQGILSQEKLLSLGAHQDEVIDIVASEPDDPEEKESPAPAPTIQGDGTNTPQAFSDQAKERVRRKITHAKTKEELQIIYNEEPLLFMDDPKTELNQLFEKRMNEIR